MSLITKIIFGLSIIGLSTQNLQAADDYSMESSQHQQRKLRENLREEAAEWRAGARFIAHLSTDPIEVVRQAVHSDSVVWEHVGDVLRFGTIAHNLYELYHSPLHLTGERLCELVHYVGDFGERYAVYLGYTGGWRTAMNVLQFGGVAGYLGIKLYKKFNVPKKAED